MDIRKQDLRKNQILDAAMEVITRNGYENSRMDDVVKSSKMQMLRLKKIFTFPVFMLPLSKPAVVYQNLIQYPGNLQSG